MPPSPTIRPLPLKAIQKHYTFTTSLTPDPLFPTPQSAHTTTPRTKYKTRQVQNAFYTFIPPEQQTNYTLLATSNAAFETLNIQKGDEKSKEFQETVVGNLDYSYLETTGNTSEETRTYAYPWAQRYGGWQFGQWAGQLGDGRAISLFEILNQNNQSYELQLKGAGTTPYSRFGDGKAVLRSSIREFIVSEALHALRIPTTRALAISLIKNSPVQREVVEPRAIVARFAQSWVRIGNFDILRATGERDNIRKLCTYLGEKVFGGWDKLVSDDPDRSKNNRFVDLYREIVRRNAVCVAHWQAYGFMNGVLNTDNTSVFGLSLDFGPFAFMDDFDPDHTPNHDDHTLRYSYANQPAVIWWNLVRLGESLAELMGIGSDVDTEGFMKEGMTEENKEAIIMEAKKIIMAAQDEFQKVYLNKYQTLMMARLGLTGYKTDADLKVVNDCTDMLTSTGLDFHYFFRQLSSLELNALKTPEGIHEAALKVSKRSASSLSDGDLDHVRSFLELWRSVSEDVHGSASEVSRQSSMQQVNPKFVPRNWVLEEVIRRVQDNGEFELITRVLNMALRPFDESWNGNQEDEERFCGPVPMHKGGIQCSCSS